MANKSYLCTPTRGRFTHQSSTTILITNRTSWLEDILKLPCPRCVERGRDARKSDDATHVAEE